MHALNVRIVAIANSPGIISSLDKTLEMKRSSKVLAGLIATYVGDALSFPVKFITRWIG
jgi:hypothetical protein